jgi:hypothetical protein
MNTGIVTTNIISTSIVRAIRPVNHTLIGTGTFAWCTGILTTRTSIIGMDIAILEQMTSYRSGMHNPQT